jgi:YtkA-like
LTPSVSLFPEPGGPTDMTRTVVAFLVTLAAALGCSSGAGLPAESFPDASDTGVVGCESSLMAETYTADMVHEGAQGKYTFTLLSANPVPPGQFGNTWTLKIVDASGKPPPVADVTVDPRMPLMNHGTDQPAQITAAKDGTFEVSNIYLFMPGLWSVTLGVVSDGATVDTAAFGFCIP